ncbi:hypothetical protein GRI62_11930 [Erythrobacter arachoides]|uniref:Uncharacterized protein n=1 Tax=Aurantiacibacter arachoides TaxID=1850444 RepID=A0A845A2D8_9SPHN|nr:hypothetical protein [Aurantiacibacter arachoides]MXO94305.1 hypothetical protein [Aurantiacibacter arachoides]GGD64495.1 hypothetical protein GCM10011411_26030 [Aurantiacibacter arachoides]
MLDAPIFADIVLAVRALLALVTAYNCLWSAPWLARLWRGEMLVISTLKGGIFLISAGMLTMQSLVLTNIDQGADSAFALLGFLGLLIGSIFIAQAHRAKWVDRLIALETTSLTIERLMKDSDKETAVLDAQLERDLKSAVAKAVTRD